LAIRPSTERGGSASSCRERNVDYREIGELKSFRGSSVEQPARYVVHGIVDLMLKPDRFGGHIGRPLAIEEVIAPMQQHDARTGEIVAHRTRYRKRRRKSSGRAI